MKKTISPEHQKQLSELGCYLRELRFDVNTTQAEVCEELNLHPNTIARMENGHNMTLVSLFELCDYYQIPISQIFND